MIEKQNECIKKIATDVHGDQLMDLTNEMQAKIKYSMFMIQ